jgi:sarcosine oxidase
MAQSDADVIVVGLGAWGSAALWRLAERGVRVTGIERFNLGHSFGSTHGGTRLFRVACLEHPDLGAIALRAAALWADLGHKAGQTLLSQSGGLMLGTADSDTITGTAKAAGAAGLEVESYTAGELRQRFPLHAGITDETVGIWDPGAGLCYPEAGVRAAVGAARRAGAEVIDGIRVDAVETSASGVAVRTPVRTLHADQAVITAGAWTASLISGLPLAPRRTPMFWFGCAGDGKYSLEQFPVFCWAADERTNLWGHGSTEDFPVKLGLADSGKNFENCDPDTVDRYVRPSDHAELSAAVARLLPGLDSRPSAMAPCIITNSPDGQFIVGRHPAQPRLVVGAGDSGHGFKHSPAIGEIIAQAICAEQPELSTEFISPGRFA